VLTVYGAECLDGEIGIWTEFIEGRTLAAMMRESGPLPPADVIEIGLDLCGALAAVHAAGLLHRDVKAQNVMRESGGRIVLMDFGAGHDLEVPARAGELVGTPLYLAPEILDGGAASTHSDVYALAVLLYFLVTGSHPVSGRTLDEVRAAHREGRAVWPRDEYADVPEPLAKVITQGLVATPSERYPSVGEFEAALRGAQGGVNKPGDWIETTDDAARARRRASLLGRVSVAAGIGLIVIVGALILDLGRWRRHVDRPDFTKATPAVHRILFPRVAVTQVGWPSRDGRFFPFVDDTRNVEVFETVTGRSHRVTDTMAKGEGGKSTVMSPNGDRVAYTWTMPYGAFELRIVDADGSWPHVLIAREAAFEPVASDWSRDGRYIVCWFKRRTGDADLALVAVDGSQPRVLFTLPNAHPGRPVLSPDGRFVAYYSDSGCSASTAPERCLFIADVNGKAPRVLLHAKADGALSWTPDGKAIFFARDTTRPFQTDGWILPVRDGVAVGSPRILAANIGPVVHPTLGDNGAFAYLRDTTTAELYTATIDLTGRTVAGAPVRIPAADSDSHAAPSWSPDGRWLAYMRLPPSPNGYKPNSVLMIQDLHSGEQRQLHPTLAFLGSYIPRWLKSRALIVWGRDRESADRFGFYRVDTETSETTQIVVVGLTGFPAVFDCSPDGRDFLYVDGRRGIIVRQFGTGHERTLVPIRAGEAIGVIGMSPNGRLVAFSYYYNDEWGLAVQAIGGDRNDVVRSSQTYINFVGWTPDSRDVLYSTNPAKALNMEAPNELWRISTRGGFSLNLHLSALMSKGGRIALSPDGRRVAYSEQSDLHELWVREGFLRGLKDVLQLQDRPRP
jgi:Tol biopolymer transport system component/tRNA A-37 threonylcarbamoyl transferase component Bud32